MKRHAPYDANVAADRGGKVLRTTASFHDDDNERWSDELGLGQVKSVWTKFRALVRPRCGWSVDSVTTAVTTASKNVCDTTQENTTYVYRGGYEIIICQAPGEHFTLYAYSR